MIHKVNIKPLERKKVAQLYMQFLGGKIFEKGNIFSIEKHPKGGIRWPTLIN